MEGKEETKKCSSGGKNGIAFALNAFRLQRTMWFWRWGGTRGEITVVLCNVYCRGHRHKSIHCEEPMSISDEINDISICKVWIGVGFREKGLNF